MPRAELPIVPSTGGELLPHDTAKSAPQKSATNALAAGR
jgi:hypothetical protein